jgi:hypothetical protein
MTLSREMSTYFAPVKAPQSDNQLKWLLAKLFFLFLFTLKSCRSHQVIDFCCCAFLCIFFSRNDYFIMNFR